jgi:ATP-binding cassette, subfamily B, bacterial PglK
MFKKLVFLFSNKEKFKLASIFIFVIIGAGLEVFSMAGLAVFVGLFLDENNKIYEWFSNLGILDISSEIELIQIFGIAVGVLFVLKNAYLLYINYILHKFIYNKYVLISTKLLRRYIEMPYINHLQTNSSYLQRNINTEVFWLFANILVPGITLLTEVIIVFSIIFALLYIEPAKTLVLICGFGSILLIVMFIIKRKMDAMGIVSQQYFGEMIKSVNQSLGSIKLTKVSRASEYFVNIFNNNVKRFSFNNASLKNISQWPRYLIEIIVVLGIVIAVIVTTYNNPDSKLDLSQLSFFGLAAVRLMPSFNRITSAYTNIRYYSASLDVVFNELNTINSDKEEVADERDNLLTFKRDIVFDNVSYKYPESINQSINNLTFKIKKGTSIALIGESGSGKTTIVDLICGLLEPSNGQIMTDGKNIFNNLHEWRSMVSYVPQDIYLLDDSVRNNIAYGVNIEDIDDSLIVRVSKLAMLDNYIEELEFGYETMIGENGVKMSGGQRQRLGIARALYNQPKILILDEGTAALDNKSQEYVINSINSMANEITVITIAHRLDTVKNCDLILLIEKGSVKKEISKNMLSKLNIDLSKLIN